MGGWVVWLEKWGLKLISTQVVVEVGVELGKKILGVAMGMPWICIGTKGLQLDYPSHLDCTPSRAGLKRICKQLFIFQS